jgi:hypothetical protein
MFVYIFMEYFFIFNLKKKKKTFDGWLDLSY